jgi:hypothetical protein
MQQGHVSDPFSPVLCGIKHILIRLPLTWSNESGPVEWASWRGSCMTPADQVLTRADVVRETL